MPPAEITNPLYVGREEADRCPVCGCLLVLGNGGAQREPCPLECVVPDVPAA